MEQFDGIITFPKSVIPGFPKWAEKGGAKVKILIPDPYEWKVMEYQISEPNTIYACDGKMRIGDGTGYIGSLPYAEHFWVDNGNIYRNILEEMFTLNGTQSMIEKERLVLKFI